jgi:hypothetical protein
VVLPDPDGPRRVKNSPALISKSTPSTALTLSKDFASARIWINPT